MTAGDDPAVGVPADPATSGELAGDLGIVTPFWLDRPDLEAVDIALNADHWGFGSLWIGEMATFDAFALATAIGARTRRLALRVGPLAVAVRSPVAMALGVSSVATLTGRTVGIALGASSPAIVTGWHDRPWEHTPARMREHIAALRAILDGERVDADGHHVRVRGFRLRSPLPGTPITVAAFGPQMTQVAGECADEVVLNVVTPAQVASARKVIDACALAAGRHPPRLAVWVAAALDPGDATWRQIAEQLAVYLAPPGYGEMFADMGFGDLVARARSGSSRADLAAAIPHELITSVAAVGSASQIGERIAAYRQAGADHVGVVPSTAEDPGGRALLGVLAPDPTGSSDSSGRPETMSPVRVPEPDGWDVARTQRHGETGGDVA